ncbi:MAG: trypsin-like peptidase domain-containing protein [Lentisphaeria bacterium]
MMCRKFYHTHFLTCRLVTWTLIVGALFSTAGFYARAAEQGEKEAGVEQARDIESAFTKVAEEASDAVVVITNKQVRQPQVDPFHKNLPPEFRRFFGMPEEDQRERRDGGQQVPKTAGRGSGVMISSEGHIVTNRHVIKDHDALEIELYDGTKYDSFQNEEEVEVVGIDDDTDLAVLKIKDEEREDFPVLKFADSSKVKVGQWALALGAPFDFDYSLTVGVVSQKGRSGVGVSRYEDYIQTDASINPGNSGGPLLNLNGEIIGINNFIVTGGGFSQGNAGVGFAIASNLVKQVTDDIVETGEVVRPWLGISMQELTPELKEQFDVSNGVLVNNVFEGQPAEKAGIQTGDVIVKVGDEEVETPHDLQFAVLKYSPGDDVEIEVLREDERKTITVTPIKRDETARRGGVPGDEDALAKAGLQLETNDRGVVITEVRNGSVADAAGLRRGDIIEGVNRKPVETVEDINNILEKVKGDTLLLYVSRGGNKFFVPLQVE